MSVFKVHSIESAPEKSKASLEASVNDFGMLPNLHGVLATSPETLEGYKTLHQLFQQTSFNNDELTVIWQTINVANSCHYCVPAHTGIAEMMNIDPAITTALRNKTPLPDTKLQALQDATKSILVNNGKISDVELESFYAAGYGQKQVLEIILGIAQKTISNYANYVASTPVDEAFEQFYI